MTREVRISDIIIPKYCKVFNSRCKHLILTSGRAGTKSSFAAIRAIYQIVSDSSASVVILRKRHNKLRKTVYKETLRAENRLCGSKRHFRNGKSPMEIEYLGNGASIYFAGSDGIDDTKGIIDEDRPIRLVILDELTEFFDDGEGEDELQNITATFARGNDGGFQMIYLYNPPKNPNAAVNLWCKKMEKRPDVVHLHTDYRDVPVDWLGTDLIHEAEALRELDERMYRWLWLGEAVGVDELIYYMFGERHRRRPGQDHYRIIGIGADYGQQNATTYQAAGLDEYNHRLDGLGEYFHSGRDTGRQKSPSEYAQEFIKFTEKLHETYECSYFYAFLDPSAQGLKEEIRRASQGIGYTIIVKNAVNDVALGISRVQKLLTFDMLSISPEQENAVREFGTYEYDKDSIEKGKEVPVKVDDHCMDAIRYLVMGMWSKLKPYLPEDEKEPDPYVNPLNESEDDEYI